MKKPILSLGVVIALFSPTLFGSFKNRLKPDDWQHRVNQSDPFGFWSGHIAPTGVNTSSLPMLPHSDSDQYDEEDDEGNNEEKAKTRNDFIVFSKSLLVSTCVAGAGMACLHSLDGPPSILSLLVSSCLASTVSESLNNTMHVPKPEERYRRKQWDGVVIGTALSALTFTYLCLRNRQA